MDITFQPGYYSSWIPGPNSFYPIPSAYNIPPLDMLTLTHSVPPGAYHLTDQQLIYFHYLKQQQLHMHNLLSQQPKGHEIHQQQFPAYQLKYHRPCRPILPKTESRKDQSCMEEKSSNDGEEEEEDKVTSTVALTSADTIQHKLIVQHKKRRQRIRLRSSKELQDLWRIEFRDGERWFVCNSCERIFRWSSNLKRHLRIHTG